MKRPANWETTLAAASGFVYAAAVLTIGIPALTHHGKVPHGEYVTGLTLGAIAIVLFFGSVGAALVNTSTWYRRHRRNR